jgi:hypothetical protein
MAALTPAQVQEQQDAQDAQDAADAAAAAAAAAPDAPRPEGFWMNLLGNAGEFAHGAGEGVASLADLPSRAGTGIANLYNRAAGKPLAEPQLTGAVDLYNKYVPPVPGYRDSAARVAGNLAGPLIVTGGLGAPAAGARLPEIVSTLTSGAARTGVNAGLIKGGSELGGAVGHAITGGEGGQTYGELLGGGLAVPVGGYLGREALSRGLTNPGGPASSAARLRAADQINVPPSLGLVGNKLAAYLEDALSVFPYGGGPSYAARRAQYGALDAAARENAAQLRGAPRTGPISKAGLGEQGIGVATTADRNIQDAIDYQYNDPVVGLHGQIDPATGQPRLPRATPVSVVAERAARASMLDDPLTDLATQGPTIRHFGQMSDVNSRFPVDQALDQTLRAQRAQAAAPLPANATPADVAAQQALLARIDSDIWDNTGPSFQVERSQRGYGTRTDTGVALDAGMRRAIRVAQTQTMRDAATRAGIPAGVFDAIEQRASELMDQRDAIGSLTPDRLGKTIPQGEAYTKLFGGSGQANLDQMRALAEHDPRGLAQLMADQYELQTRGPVAAGTPDASPETLDPGKASAWWSQQNHPDVRDLYAPNPALAERMNATDLLMRAAKTQPTRTLPGKGGNTLGGPGILSGITSTGIGGLVAALTGSPIAPAAIAAALGTPALARFIGNRFTSDQFTRSIVNPPSLAESMLNRPTLSRILSNAAISGLSGQPYSGAAMTQGQLNDALRKQGYDDATLAGMSMGDKMKIVSGQAGAR